MSLRRVVLDEREIPQVWYNLQADLPEPLPTMLHPVTRNPLVPDDLAAIFPPGLIEQELSRERFIDIPGEVMDIYRSWRPTPLIRALKLEQLLETPAHIYYKYEGPSPAGSHKLNSSAPQAYYNKQAGIKRLTTETGAGQWGSALSIACQFFGLECTVFMVRVSYDQKPYRRTFIETYGGRAVSSPSQETEAGRKVLAEQPDTPGTMGIAISEAVEVAAQNPDTNYALGSVLNHVLLHQSVVGQEAKNQLEKVGCFPDVIIGCHGGGSNFGGLIAPFIRDKIEGKAVRIIAVEPTSCPTLTKGKYDYDYCDTFGLTPLIKMYSMGHTHTPPGIHAGGLRYHGASPIISSLLHHGLIEAQAYHQTDIFGSAISFARTEGILPAPESAHAIHAAVEEALKARETGEEKTILFGLSGHGHFDMSAYEDYLAGKLG
ncbi:MAG TPA: TrpB-like pyridoxal phosphate-dependent enzyme [Peptococcaceae bacterium]|nr:TrpB-like pyridoxal phosphate-dependent enzyme [Peptococcaceae bacterium]